MKKSKGQTIDLLYTNNKDNNSKKTKNKKSVEASSARPQKKNKVKSNKSKTKKVQNNDNEIINLDNEIIIGLTPKKTEEKKQKNTKTKKSNNKKTKNKKSVGADDPVRPTKNKKINSRKKTANKKQNLKQKRKIKMIKWTMLFILIVTAIVLFMMSSVFNIKEIIVVNNNKVPSQEIINLSTLTTGVNMFKITNRTIEDGIKANAYVESVNIKRNLNGTITLDIKERVPKFMLKLANTYVYINNQGYMLEISENPLELPIITGFATSNEEIETGNRLNKEDLQKLDDVIKIIETSKNTPLANIITSIDISDYLDYKLTVESEEKIIRIGTMTNINIKLQMAGKVFEAEKGKTGEIYFQEDGKKAIFKEEVAR